MSRLEENEDLKAEDIKLLVIEDDETFNSTICEIFSLFKFTVTSASNGQAGLDLLQKEKFNIVISDMRMPGLSGFEVLQKVKAKNCEFPKFIAISGFTDYSIAQLYQAGVDGFFPKPFDFNEVKACITRSLVSEFERWAQPQKFSNHLFTLVKRFNLFEEAVKNREIAFGRLGFFLPLQGTLPKTGETIAFDFSFGSPKPELVMKGHGKVSFQVDKSSYQSQAGVGIEILRLEPASLAQIAAYLLKLKPLPSIPNQCPIAD
jgi:DNA-binding response OmpR family regulator